MKEILVDSSVYISSFFEGEEFSDESQSFFDWILKNEYRLILPISAFFEILHASFRKGGAKVEPQVLDHLIQLSQGQWLRVIPLEANFSSHYFDSHTQYDLKTADSIVVVTAEMENVQLVSWDTQLNRTASKKIRATTPTEFLAQHRVRG